MYQSISELPELRNIDGNIYLIGIDTTGIKPKVRRLKLSRLQSFLGAGGAASFYEQTSYTSALLRESQTQESVIQIAKSFILTKIKSSQSAWIRLYAGISYQQADRNRLISDDPVGNHGVLMDVSTRENDETRQLSPQIAIANSAIPRQSSFPISITNLAQISNPITVTLEYLVIP